MRIGLLRHPQLQPGAALCYGRIDRMLAEGWRAGLEAQLWRVLRLRPTLVRSSPQPRCREPAEWLAARLGVDCRLDDRLRELDFGHWEGVPWSSLDRRLLEAWAADPLGFRPPGGESGRELLQRVAAAAHDMRQDPCLVVSHGGPLRLLPALLRDTPPCLLAAAPAPGRLRIMRAPPAP